MIKTHAVINDAGKLLRQYLPLTLLQGFENACVGFYCEMELEIEQKLQYFDPHSYARQRCVFLFFFYMLNLWSTLLGDSFFYCFLSASSLDPNSSGPQAPSAWCGFPYHISSPIACNSTGRRTQLSYIIVRRPLDLWNRMFNRHQAEITVMQFRCHSLPVHHSVVAQWDLHLVPYYQP